MAFSNGEDAGIEEEGGGFGALTLKYMGFTEEEKEVGIRWKSSDYDMKFFGPNDMSLSIPKLQIMDELIACSRLEDDDYESEELNEEFCEIYDKISDIKTLTKEAKQKVIIESLLEEQIDWDDFSDSAPQTKHAMIIELFRIAISELNAPTELDKFTIEMVAKKLNVSTDVLNKLEEHAKSLLEVTTNGIKLIESATE
jgi:hypothetical protein